MKELTKFYINGEWVDPVDQRQIEVINPATEQPVAKISMAGAEDVNRAVAAAKAAFPGFSATSRDERLALLNKLAEVYKERYNDMAEAITLEMGAPVALSQKAQAATGLGHITTAAEVLKTYEFEEDLGTTHVFKEAIGVCGMITPWNWPINQIMCKVAPALATGCTIILKPSQVAPLDAYVLAEMIDAAGYPPGVFNLVNGSGPQVGEWLSSHPDVDMISLTGSTYAGAQVSKHAADTIKRVSLELGGKSANIILDDADLEKAVKMGVMSCFNNTGQSCNAPTRMLVPADKHDQVVEIAKAVAEKVVVGAPDDPSTVIGPQANRKQWETVQKLIQKAVDEGCQLVCGGTGKPEGLDTGFYTKPTIFANLKNSDTIAQEEVFGPVLAIIPYQDEEDAIRIANDSIYGLSGYVQSGDLERARRVASRMRTGMVHINGAPVDVRAPFGGYKQSGNGREWGAHGFDEFLEIKAVMGYEARK
ncbi:aldehyde dehydrogenase family protein [Gilvimarinus sp. F26214L]|uniref:aldehyde dehydrogenase family protein n=1 Tax=Gilvimarinus sp. DZF01 TaxID=3461371 RepID=UPI004046474A